MRFKENRSLRKLRGGTYAKPQIAGCRLAWDCTIGSSSIPEPSRGNGVLFPAFLDKRLAVPPEIVGSEYCPDEAAKADTARKELHAAEDIEICVVGASPTGTQKRPVD